MADNKGLAGLSASRLIASIFGVLGGIGGLTHGIGESLQGSVAPGGLYFPSWAQGPIADHMDGDPALSIIPNLLVTGILAIIVSLIVMVWSAAFVQRKRGGLVLIGLMIVLLLVGGGVGPIVVGVLAGVAGQAINAPLTGWRRRVPGLVRRALAMLWPLVFGISLLSGLLLFLGSIVLMYVFDVGNSDLYFGLFQLTAVALLLAVITGAAYDAERAERGAVGVAG
jgi:hypothetical protein